MKKFLAALSLAIILAVFAAAETLHLVSEDKAISLLEEMTGVNVIYAEYGEDDALIFIGERCGRLNRTWRDEYLLDDLKKFAEQYKVGELDELPPVTGKLNLLLTEEFYDVQELFELLDIKLLPVVTAWEPIEFNFEGLAFEAYPDNELKIARMDVIFHAYYLETVKIFVD